MRQRKAIANLAPDHFRPVQQRLRSVDQRLLGRPEGGLGDFPEGGNQVGNGQS